jgi:hypothetical protein
MASASNRIYLYSTAAFMLVLPLGSIATARFFGSSDDLWALAGKWFVFWAVGVRLLTAGIKQAAQPAFTAAHIFGIAGSESHVIVRELGFANICMGMAGVASLIVTSWRTAAAFTGGLYFGLAGVMHLIKGASTRLERIALISDLFIFGVLASCLLHTLVT